MKQKFKSLPRHEDWLHENLKDKNEAEHYLQAALDELQTSGNQKAFLCALRQVASAQGGLSALAKESSLNRESLYAALSEKGNPKLETMGKILKVLGYHFMIKASAKKVKKKEILLQKKQKSLVEFLQKSPLKRSGLKISRDKSSVRN